MIERIVLLKLTDGLCHEAGRVEVAEYSQRVLSAVPGVVDCTTSIAADEKTLASWDVCLKIRLPDLDAYGVYAVDPSHREYLDDYLPTRTTFKKAWNFETSR